MKNKIWLPLIMLFTSVISMTASAQQMQKMSKDSFMVMVQKENIQLVDVRTPEEYNKGHISGALLADWRNKKSFRKKLRKLDKDRPVFIYCASGRRSNEAAKWLTKKGFAEVVELEDGIKDKPEIMTRD